MCRRPTGGWWPFRSPKGGSEQGTLHFFEVDTGRELADEIPRVQFPTGGGSAAWTADGSGVFYTRYPHQGERPEADANFYQQVWFHRLGTPVAEDQYEIGKDFPRIAEIETGSQRGRPMDPGAVANGDGGDFAHYLRDAVGPMAAADALRGRHQAGRSSAATARSTCSPARTRRAGKCCGSWQRPDERLEQLWRRRRWWCRKARAWWRNSRPADHGLYVSDILGGPSALCLLPARQHAAARAFPILPVSAVSGLRIAGTGMNWCSAT